MIFLVKIFPFDFVLAPPIIAIETTDGRVGVIQEIKLISQHKKVINRAHKCRTNAALGHHEAFVCLAAEATSGRTHTHHTHCTHAKNAPVHTEPIAGR